MEMDGSLAPLLSLFIWFNQEIGEIMTKTLPKDFIFGGATAAYPELEKEALNTPIYPEHQATYLQECL